MTTERDGTWPDPTLVGSLSYLLLNLPIGIGSFVFVVTFASVGLSTVIIWVGIAILAVGVVTWRGAAQLERMRVHVMLGTYIAAPYRPLPEHGLTHRLGVRLKDPATYKDMAYHLLLLPIGIAEFTMVITAWATSLSMLLLPIYHSWLPDWYPTIWHDEVLRVDSWPETLPRAALGMLGLAFSILLTKALGTLHARYARAMLGPSQHRIDRLSTLDTAGAIDWSNTATVSR
jgi:hypothetical protein